MKTTKYVSVGLILNIIIIPILILTISQNVLAQESSIYIIYNEDVEEEDGTIRDSMRILFGDVGESGCAFEFIMMKNDEFSNYGSWDVKYDSGGNNSLDTTISCYAPIIFIENNSDDVITWIDKGGDDEKCEDLNLWDDFKWGSIEWLQDNMVNYSEDDPTEMFEDEDDDVPDPTGIKSVDFNKPDDVSSNQILWSYSYRRVLAKLNDNYTADWDIIISMDLKYSFDLTFTEITENFPIKSGTAILKISLTIEDFSLDPYFLSTEYLGGSQTYSLSNLSIAKPYGYTMEFNDKEEHLPLEDYCEDADDLLDGETHVADSTEVTLYGKNIAKIEYGETYELDGSDTCDVKTCLTRKDDEDSLEEIIFYHNFIEFGGKDIEQDPEFQFFYEDLDPVYYMVVISCAVATLGIVGFIIKKKNSERAPKDE